MSLSRVFLHRGQLSARWASALLAFSVTLFLGVSASADEGGVPFWLSGSYSSFAAVPQQPGWYMPTQLYYYNGDASGTKNFQRGDSVNLGLSSKLAMIFLTPTWVPNEKWFGGQPSFALTFGGGWNSTSANTSLSTLNGTQTLNRSDSDSGGSDLYPQAQIAWNSGNNNWMAYITGDLPVRSYSSTRLSNIGLGHTAADIGGAYTYLNSTSGFEASATIGFHLQRHEHQHELPERSGLASGLGRLTVSVTKLASQADRLRLLPAYWRQRQRRPCRIVQIAGRCRRPRGGLFFHRGRAPVVCESARLQGVLGGEPPRGLCPVRDAEHPARRWPEEYSGKSIADVARLSLDWTKVQ
jgi:hypothetical protein